MNWAAHCWPASNRGAGAGRPRLLQQSFWDEAAATGAQLLWRVQSSLKLHVVTELADGSYLSVLLTDIERQRIRRHRARGMDTVPHGPTVRVIENDITNRDTDGGPPGRRFSP